MNVVIVKLAGIASYGVASVDFELLLSTLLFISREGMRNALLRVESDPPAHRNSRQKPGVKDQLLINASLVPIGLGMVMANLVFLVFKSTSDSDWKTAIVIYIIAGWVELCVEPLYVLSRAQVLFQVQAKCEGIAVTARCITVTTLLITGRHIADADDNNPYSLLAFAAGQMVYALTILATYAWYMSHELEYPVWHCYVPRQIASSGHFVMPETRKLAVTFVGQSLLKHCLTQGDNMLMVKYASNAIKGTFAMVSNYGSIPARIIFLPLEEASRAMFSRQSTATSAQQTENARLVRRVIEILAKFQLLLGSILVVFGTLYSSTFMALLGQDDPTASNTMSMYCLYLPLMGLNGFLEAFVHSVADRNQLLHVNIWMIICTITYVVISVQILSVLQLGSAGIVAANMVNMAMRIVYCTRFVKT
ncbi:Oligosaccharide translocation protein rft1, partial [Linderina macrospora]